MTTLALNKYFPIFNQKGNSVVRKQSKREFDQAVQAAERSLEYKDSAYSLDSLSRIVTNQSLSPEQIAKSQSKETNEKVNFLSQKYEIKKTDEVKSFISKNRFLISLLEEIPNKIFQYFGNEQKFALEVFYEPDFPQSSELWVSVLTELSAEEARSIMDKFDEDWWLDNIDRAKCKLNIGIDYV
jgi:hypothetical protein